MEIKRVDGFPDYADSRSAAAATGSVATYITKLCRAGKLPGSRQVGWTWLIPVKTLEMYIAWASVLPRDREYRSFLKYYAAHTGK